MVVALTGRSGADACVKEGGPWLEVITRRCGVWGVRAVSGAGLMATSGVTNGCGGGAWAIGGFCWVAATMVLALACKAGKVRLEYTAAI